MCGRGQLRSSRQRSLWWPIRSFEFLDCSDRNLRVCLASLWRLQRLQRYCARQRSIAGLPFHSQLSAALFVASPSGVLAALAHQFEHLAPRLLVHSFGRQCRRRMENLAKPSSYYGPGWPLAWRKLDVCGLWGNSWHCFGCGTLLFSCQNKAKRCSPAPTFRRGLLPLGPANPDIQCLLSELGILPCHLTPCGGAVPGWPV